MKILGLFIVLIGISSFAEKPHETSFPNTGRTEIQIVELSNYSFSADSFFDERNDSRFQEKPAEAKFQRWASEAVGQVNCLIPREDRLDKVKLKLIFQANIQSSSGLLRAVPISIIDSYQEPRTLSIRLGMLELKDNETSFKITVAHEYSHLVFENASRKAGTTPESAELLSFWSKPIYEGVADAMASMALDTHYTGDLNTWATRDLYEFKTIEEAQNAADTTVVRAREAFQKLNLIPKYQIYENWLETVEKFVEASGGKDPYAEGGWLAGRLLKIASTQKLKQRLSRELVARAKSGQVENDSRLFLNKLKSIIKWRFSPKSVRLVS